MWTGSAGAAATSTRGAGFGLGAGAISSSGSGSATGDPGRHARTRSEAGVAHSGRVVVTEASSSPPSIQPRSLAPITPRSPAGC